MAKLSLRSRFWLLTASALLVSGGTFSLGQWQLRRAAQKQNLQLAIETQGSQSILKAQDLADSKTVVDAIYRRAALKGIWRPEYTVFLDNRQMNGTPGFFVLTPLTLDDTGQIILVQRGWAPRNFTSRAVLPDIQTPVGPVTVLGRIAPPPSKLYEFKAVQSGRIRQNLDMTLFSREIALPLLPVSMLQTGPPDEGLLREWPAPNVGVERHYGYAFQWFSLCALVVGLYIWFQFINPWRDKRKTFPNV